MPVAAADLIYPVGSIRTEWYPGEDLAANLTLWLADGVAAAPAEATEAQIDAVATAWANYRAYRTKAEMVAATPSGVGISGALNVSQGKDRPEFFAAEAERWLALYDAAISDATPVVDAFAGYAVPTHSVARTVAW